MKRILIAAALVAIMASAAYAAPPPGKGKPENPGQSNAHKAGENGSPNSANNVNNANANNPAKACKKERTDLGVDAFKSKYGTNANKANSFGKCVSSKSKGSGESDDD